MHTRLAWRRWTRRLTGDESGQGLAEYALILVFIAIVCVGAVGALGQAIVDSPGFGLFGGD